ncbi:FAD-dependent oxidoreductase [Kineococcus rubinsiae]|uniref:FAD-dependent oxidoreductase n=1 Tax=Kineococcus rubinsiae TaxID=2609562 RepID=UPI00142FD884|nr:FAD-dependent oxidoreductase [Kineococcus rubinsiae]
MSADPAGPRRRTVVRAAAGAALATALAACGPARPGATPPPTTPPPTTTPPTTPPPSLDALARQVSGGVAVPGRAGYDADRLLYNPRFAGSAAPQGIAACRSAEDVAACVRFAAASGTPLHVRAGGHSYAGASSGGGLVVDLAPMAAVEVDAAAGTARIGAGALLADVYARLGAAGVAVGAGSCPTVGFSGLALGGGVGVLARTTGLTCDQVVAADVVTADGRRRTVDAGADPDLFWALRGGGPGLAVVTSWTVRTTPAPDVTVFALRWGFEQAAAVLAAWQEWAPAAPRELWSTCKLLVGPGGAKVQVSGAWTGTGALDGPLRGLLAALPAPVARSRRALGYAAAMAWEAGCSGLDAPACTARALDAGHRQPFAATSSMLREPLPAAGIDALVAAVAAVGEAPPAGLVEAGASFDALGGAVADVAADATAFPWRSALATVQHTATWSGAGRAAAAFDEAVASTRTALAPWTGTAAYVNYADRGLPDLATACWGDNLPRLSAVRRAVDPDGVLASPSPA